MKNKKNLKKKSKLQTLKKNYDFKNSIDDDDDIDNDQFSNSKKGQNTTSKTPVLDSFSRDLTKMAQDGKLDLIVGRNKEIERVSQILSRRKKNNPCIIGEAGCVDGLTFVTVRKVSDSGSHYVSTTGE